jgi:hypothetical protein
MKIKYLSGPKAGQVDHVENSVGRFAVGAGLAEQIATDAGPIRDAMGLVTIPAPKPGSPIRKTNPEWEVSVINVGIRSFLAIKVTTLNQSALYSGLPERTPKNIGGWPVPKDVADSYRREYVNSPAMRDEIYAEPESQSCPHNVEQARLKAQADEALLRNSRELAGFKD